MIIFISYASEDRVVAESIALTLRGRGHRVFFDKDSLPPASDFAAQIEEAIRRADLLVFLISPHAVAPGFTRTELFYAQRKWPGAKGRVLPVEISPTPLSDIPAYLTTVQIYKPAGDISAEVATIVEDIVPTARPQHILPVALLLGVGGGLLSAVGPLHHGAAWLRNNSTEIFGFLPSGLDWLTMPMSFPAPYLFAVAVAILVKVWDKASLARVAAIFPVVFVAWICAYLAAFSIVMVMDQTEISFEATTQSIMRPFAPRADQCRTSGDELAAACAEIEKYRTQLEPFFRRLSVLVYVTAGFAGGLIGATLTILGLGRISRRLRPLDAVALVIFVGSAAGTSLALRSVDDWAVFVIWQTSVLAAIAWQFTKPAPREFAG